MGKKKKESIAQPHSGFRDATRRFREGVSKPLFGARRKEAAAQPPPPDPVKPLTREQAMARADHLALFLSPQHNKLIEDRYLKDWEKLRSDREAADPSADREAANSSADDNPL